MYIAWLVHVYSILWGMTPSHVWRRRAVCFVHLRAVLRWPPLCFQTGWCRKRSDSSRYSPPHLREQSASQSAQCTSKRKNRWLHRFFLGFSDDFQLSFLTSGHFQLSFQSPFLMGKSAIFNSYVKLPEVISKFGKFGHLFWSIKWAMMGTLHLFEDLVGWNVGVKLVQRKRIQTKQPSGLYPTNKASLNSS